MKLILENWRVYLEGQDKKPSYQIYCDMDGVLVDFEKEVINYINEDLRDESRVPENVLRRYKELQGKLNELGRDQEVELNDLSKDPDFRVQAVRKYMYARVQDDFDFWAGLDWMPDGKQLWNHIKDMTPQIIILTTPMQGEGSREGKKEWVRRELGAEYQVILEEEKWKYSGPNKLLIDDFLSNIEPWSEEGLAIHHQNASDSIAELEEKLSETPI